MDWPVETLTQLKLPSPLPLHTHTQIPIFLYTQICGASNSRDAMSLYFNHVRTAVTTWIVTESMVCLQSLMKDTVDAQFQINPYLFFFASVYVWFCRDAE